MDEYNENYEEEQGTNTSEEGKKFSQDDVNRIVAERLARAKSEKPADLDDLKAIAEKLEELGYSGSTYEKRQALEALVASYKEPEQVIDDVVEDGEIPDEAVLKALAKKFGTTPEKLEKSMKKAIEADDADERKTQADADWERQVAEFETAHADTDLEELNKDAKFIKFAKTHNGSLSTIYEDYLEILQETEANIADKFKKSESRSTGAGGKQPQRGSIKLSTEEQNTLNDWNRKNPQMQMTPQKFKEYKGGQ